jgi:hypothetical protein
MARILAPSTATADSQDTAADLKHLGLADELEPGEVDVPKHMEPQK